MELNHTIIWCNDKKKSADFVSELLGQPAPFEYGPFLVMQMDNGVSVDFADHGAAIGGQHYAFLITEEEFDQVYERVRTSDIDYWADPRQSELREINRRDGGRGMYFKDFDGNLLEVLTRPYGSGE